MFTEYSGKRVVITGGANGIGRELALGCAKRGADVLIADIHGDEAANVAQEIRALGRRGEFLEADVSLSEECQKIFEQAMAVFDGCDFLINDAGVSNGADICDIREQDIKWVTEVNVYAHWYMMQRFIPQMRKQGTHCQILNVCSIAGLMTLGSAPIYFSTKHAAVALSECVYKSLKASGDDIDISVFCPGFVQTQMHLTDRHRPARFAIDPEDPYYRSEEYQKFIAYNKVILDNGSPLVPTIEKVFELLREKRFFILTDEKYDRLLREQGVYQANMTEPIDLSMLKG
ncbi:MAG: SDR family NAD(P)-dependent oxidoreductase [Lachnospiraceae bacterium]|nr:SDR family NAD(P)-dependent oxidoreductase [Lachnospiraceae bacterium]